MYFEKINAIAFGPLLEKVLELSPGLNVVFGLNEAGKSAWHAAIYAGLCGMRRGKGMRAEDQAFRERHRPWRGDERGFEVGVQVALEDGNNRRVELIQDLESRVAVVRDSVLPGRDYASEILHDGAPDGSKWLGLTRENFQRTACIRQAQILRVAERQHAEGLQEALQEAATAGSRFTARAAISTIEEFRRREIGSDNAPTKPRRVTNDRVAELESRIESARAERKEWDGSRQRLEVLKAKLSTARAGLAGHRAAKAEARLKTAEAMGSVFPDGAPAASAAAPELQVRVGEAVGAFQTRADPARHSESRLQEIDREIADTEAALKQQETRLSPDEEARDQLRKQLETRQTANQSRTTEVARGSAELGQIDTEIVKLTAHQQEAEKELTEEREALDETLKSLRDIEEQVKGNRVQRDRANAEGARILSEQSEVKARAMGLDAELKAEGELLRSVQSQIDEITARVPDPPALSEETRWSRRPSLTPLLGLVATLLVGTGLTALGLTTLGVVLLGTGAAGLIVWALHMWRAAERRGSREEPDRLRERLRELQTERTGIEGRVARLEFRQSESADRLAQLEQNFQAQQERKLENARRDLETQQRKVEREASRHQVRAESLDKRIAERRDEITELSGRRAEAREALDQGEARVRETERDLETCRESLKQAEQTVSDRKTRIAALEVEREERTKSRSEARNDLETKRAKDVDAADEAERQLRQVAAEVLGDEATGRYRDSSRLVSALHDWQQRQRRAEVQDRERQRAYTKYREFVGPDGIDSLRQEARRHRREADELSTVAPDAVRLPHGEAEMAGARELQSLVSNTEREARTLEGQLQEKQRGLPSLADLQDDLEAERKILDDLEELDATLEKAVEHLKEAEEHVYLELAPKLQASVQEHLGRVTGGRYRACKIDPDTLALEVQPPNSDWVAANHLSLGTQEQIYLLLRFALAEHLTLRSQRCPLILDDVLAAADAGRKRAILDSLLALGEETQIVLFTHEDDVRDWAGTSLTADRHRLIELQRP